MRGAIGVCEPVAACVESVAEVLCVGLEIEDNGALVDVFAGVDGNALADCMDEARDVAA